MNYSIINGKFVVHGIFGETATDVYEEKDGNLTREQIKNIKNDGAEMFRIFNTPQEADAYVQGLNDMDGWLSWQKTTKSDHEKIYGKFNMQKK